MSDLQFVAVVFGSVYALFAPVFVGIELDLATPLRNRNRPVVVNLAILLFAWWPCLLVALPATCLVRLCLPSRSVNTEESA